LPEDGLTGPKRVATVVKYDFTDILKDLNVTGITF
jgi:hypothetical protein